MAASLINAVSIQSTPKICRIKCNHSSHYKSRNGIILRVCILCILVLYFFLLTVVYSAANTYKRSAVSKSKTLRHGNGTGSINPTSQWRLPVNMRVRALMTRRKWGVFLSAMPGRKPGITRENDATGRLISLYLNKYKNETSKCSVHIFTLL